MSILLFLYVAGVLLKVMAALLSVPAIVGLIYRENCCIYYFCCALACLVLGFLLSIKKPKKPMFYLRDGMKLTAFAWIVLSLIGALPLYLSGDIPVYTDALFEVISGFTTTGASVISSVDALSRAGRFWHSFTHLIGGMGILVFMLSVLPALGGSSIQLMRAESPGPSVEKITPRIQNTAFYLYAIYLSLTLLLVVLYLIGGVSLYDSLLLAFGTAGTGGFSVTDAGFAAASPYVVYLTGIFMLIFSVNFSLYYLIISGKGRSVLKSQELRFFLIMVASAVVLITINILPLFPSVSEAFEAAFFQVSSLVSSTGYSSCDFDLWPTFSKTLILTLMFVGACAGSTGGGFKVSRVLILFKAAKLELKRLIHPRAVLIADYEGKPLSDEMVRQTLCYLFIYAVMFACSVLILSLDKLSFTGAFSGTLACINNIGPGLAEVGPAAGFGSLSLLSKFVLMFDMLAGRLELYPILVLLMPNSRKLR